MRAAPLNPAAKPTMKLRWSFTISALVGLGVVTIGITGALEIVGGVETLGGEDCNGVGDKVTPLPIGLIVDGAT